MDYKLRQISRAHVTIPPVPKQQPFQMLKLSDANVTGESCLLPLLAKNAYANVCRRDHSHVIAPIAHRQTHTACLNLHELNYLCLLRRCASADQHARAKGR